MKQKILLPIVLVFIVACNVPGTSQFSVQNTPEVITQENPQSALAPETAVLPVEINAPIVDAPSLVSIHMLDVVNGWGVTDTLIVRTNDGGVTWYNVTPHGVTETGYIAASQAEFFDSTHAWLQFADPNNYPVGGTLYRTSDGGLTWTSVATPFSDGDISFIDPNNGWMMAGLGVGTGNMAVAIFQTTDGGVTWNQTYTNGQSSEGVEYTLPRGGLKSGIAPLNMQTAWVYGVTYSVGTAYVYRTDDGGKTWALVPMQLTPEAVNAELWVENIKFTSASQGTLLMRITGPKIRMIVYQTNDGGNTWLPASATVPGSGFSDIVSAQEIVIYATDQLYVTKDASVTWEIISPDVVFGESMNLLDFVTASTGWVITSDTSDHHTLYRTENGGSTWFPIIP